LIGGLVGWSIVSRLPPENRLVALDDPGQNLALDGRTCIQIHREAGHINPASAICLLDFTQIPNGLNAEELEKNLREHGVSSGSR
jgi:hypothetical protein